MRRLRFVQVILLILSSRAAAAQEPVLIDNPSRIGLDSLYVAASSETFEDPATGVIFPRSFAIEYRGAAYRLRATGSGARKKMLFKVYGAALYADERVPLGSNPLQVLTHEDVARRIVMVLRRDVGSDKIREAFREGLEKVWKAKPGPDLSRDLDEFMSFFGNELKSGQSIELTYLPQAGLFAVVNGQSKPVVTNPDITRSIWSVWLGPDPVSEDLRRDLVRLSSAIGE